MTHKDASVLKMELKEAETTVPVGARYAHYKHPETPYVIVGHGLLEANDEVAVIYKLEEGNVPSSAL